MDPGHKIKISIVTVSFNQGKFIEDNIKSVINQNYQNIEHIIIDAGSTDDTLEILKKYDKYINWISEPDRGQSDGLNKGFKKATGEIIGWINSDDRLAPGALQRIARFFIDNPDENAVVGNINLIDENGGFIKEVLGEPYEFNQMVKRKRGVTQPSTFFKRLVLEKIGYLDTNLHYAMDFEFFLRISSLKLVPHINTTLSEFRLHSDSKTTNKLNAFRMEHLKIALKYNAPLWSKGIRSDLYVIVTDPFRRIHILRNFIRRIRGLEEYDASKFN